MCANMLLLPPPPPPPLLLLVLLLLLLLLLLCSSSCTWKAEWCIIERQYPKQRTLTSAAPWWLQWPGFARLQSQIWGVCLRLWRRYVVDCDDFNNCLVKICSYESLEQCTLFSTKSNCVRREHIPARGRFFAFVTLTLTRWPWTSKVT